MKIVVSLISLTLASGAALAAQDIGGPPDIWADGWINSGVIKTNRLPDNDELRMGANTFRFRLTHMRDIARVSGQPLRQRGEVGASLDWVCLHQDGKDFDTRIWLTSNERAGDLLNGVQMLRLTADSAADPNCGPIAPGLLPIRLPTNVRIGDEEQALRRRLGAPAYDLDGTVTFMRTIDLFDERERAACILNIAQWVRVRDGKVQDVRFERQEDC